MGTTYWVRHPGLPGFMGPFDHAQLRVELDAGRVGTNAEVIEATDLGEADLDEAEGWQALATLLDIEVAPPTRPRSREARAKSRLRRERGALEKPQVDPVLHDVRSHSRYRKLRVLVDVLTVVALVVSVVGWGIACSQLPRDGALLFFTVTGACMVEVITILVVRYVVLLLSDIADVQLRQEQRAQP